ncbi:MAG: T9SS type A sorting domain-containing protein [Flavobacteriaceae bacterium]|nr:T9SS type A sorting domain-containing protein [Flavobacteriaceae bacterium]
MKRKATIIIIILFFFPFVWQLNATSIKENAITNIIAPPANDECANATTLTVNSNFLCTTKTAGTVAEATGSGVSTGCPGNSNANDDVWYKFVATDTSHKIELSNIAGSNTDLYYIVYEGGTTGNCNTMTAIFCGSANPGTPPSLTVGNTYFINVFTNSTVSGANTTFDICVGSTATAPSNDDCADAENIALASLPFDATYDATSATNNAGSITVSGCTDINDGVWYTVIGDGTEITVIANPDSWDAAITVYEGSCGTFTCVGSSNNGASDIAEGVTFTSTSSTTYYINIAHPGITDEPEGVFDLSVTSAVLSIDDIVAKGFYYYPNPVEKILKMNAKESIDQISLYTILGREIKRFTQSNVKAELDMSSLPSGTYFVKVVIGDSSGSFKIIKN